MIKRASAFLKGSLNTLIVYFLQLKIAKSANISPWHKSKNNLKTMKYKTLFCHYIPYKLLQYEVEAKHFSLGVGVKFIVVHYG